MENRDRKDDSDTAISDEEAGVFKCDTPGEFYEKLFDIGGFSALAWQMGDLTVICDSGASCHMSHSSAGMLNYRESNANMRTASGEIYPIEGYGNLPLTFRSTSGDVPVAERCSTYAQLELPFVVFESYRRQRSHVHWESGGSYRVFQNW